MHTSDPSPLDILQDFIVFAIRIPIVNFYDSIIDTLDFLPKRPITLPAPGPYDSLELKHIPWLIKSSIVQAIDDFPKGCSKLVDGVCVVGNCLIHGYHVVKTRERLETIQTIDEVIMLIDELIIDDHQSTCNRTLTQLRSDLNSLDRTMIQLSGASLIYHFSYEDASRFSERNSTYTLRLVFDGHPTLDPISEELIPGQLILEQPCFSETIKSFTSTDHNNNPVTLFVITGNRYK